jgi:hypothetical protein
VNRKTQLLKDTLPDRFEAASFGDLAATVGAMGF